MGVNPSLNGTLFCFLSMDFWSEEVSTLGFEPGISAVVGSQLSSFRYRICLICFIAKQNATDIIISFGLRGAREGLRCAIFAFSFSSIARRRASNALTSADFAPFPSAAWVFAAASSRA